LSPSHEVCPNCDVGQVTHAVPQAATFAASTQMPPQEFLPSGHFPSQAAPSSTQVSMHGFFPAGHRTPHFTPSQMLSPPAMVGQGLQATPQLMGIMLSTHTPLHE
jgi:hypothetical protein